MSQFQPSQYDCGGECTARHQSDFQQTFVQHIARQLLSSVRDAGADGGYCSWQDGSDILG